MSDYKVNLKQIREYEPCIEGWQVLLDSKGKTSADDEMFDVADIYHSNDLDDFMWSLRALDEKYYPAIYELVKSFVDHAYLVVPNNSKIADSDIVPWYMEELEKFREGKFNLSQLRFYAYDFRWYCLTVVGYFAYENHCKKSSNSELAEGDAAYFASHIARVSETEYQTQTVERWLGLAPQTPPQSRSEPL